MNRVVCVYMLSEEGREWMMLGVGGTWGERIWGGE